MAKRKAYTVFEKKAIGGGAFRQDFEKDFHRKLDSIVFQV